MGLGKDTGLGRGWGQVKGRGLGKDTGLGRGWGRGKGRGLGKGRGQGKAPPVLGCRARCAQALPG